MKPLLLLHGAIGAANQLQALKNVLGAHYEVYTLNFTGHGGEKMSDESFSMSLFTDNILQFMEQQGLKNVSIFGYSMGGYVGLYLARHYPEKVEKVVTLATKFHWDEATAARETQMLNPAKMEEKIPAFAQALCDRHQPNDWKEVLHKTAAMMTALGTDNTLKQEDYGKIQAPILVLLGDRDKMVGLDETLNTYKTLPNARMGMLPNTQHPIEQVSVDMLSFMIRSFV